MKRALDVSRFIWKENTIASNAVNQTIKKLCVLLGFLDSQKIREATTADFFRIGRTFLIVRLGKFGDIEKYMDYLGRVYDREKIILGENFIGYELG